VHHHPAAGQGSAILKKSEVQARTSLTSVPDIQALFVQMSGPCGTLHMALDRRAYDHQ
jgi:hypothetical protein